jgi:hypothetical protein
MEASSPIKTRKLRKADCDPDFFFMIDFRMNERFWTYSKRCANARMTMNRYESFTFVICFVRAILSIPRERQGVSKKILYARDFCKRQLRKRRLAHSEFENLRFLRFLLLKQPANGGELREPSCS